jgi:hypothetical protein
MLLLGMGDRGERKGVALGSGLPERESGSGLRAVQGGHSDECCYG